MAFERAMLKLLALLPQPLQELMMKPLMLQIMRFAVVGGLAFIVDFGLLLLLTEGVGLNYLVSATISFIASVLFNYVLSIMWVFTNQKPTAPQSKAKSKAYATFKAVLFFALSTMGLFINNGIMWAFVELLGLSYIIGKLVATAVVMVFNFITRKILIEGWKRNHPAPATTAPASDAPAAASPASTTAPAVASEPAPGASAAPTEAEAAPTQSK